MAIGIYDSENIYDNVSPFSVCSYENEYHALCEDDFRCPLGYIICNVRCPNFAELIAERKIDKRHWMLKEVRHLPKAGEFSKRMKHCEFRWDDEDILPEEEETI